MAALPARALRPNRGRRPVQAENRRALRRALHPSPRRGRGQSLPSSLEAVENKANAGGDGRMKRTQSGSDRYSPSWRLIGRAGGMEGGGAPRKADGRIRGRKPRLHIPEPAAAEPTQSRRHTARHAFQPVLRYLLVRSTGPGCDGSEAHGSCCRRSKVKCAHSGSLPCQRCRKSAIDGCLLVRPSPGRGFARKKRVGPASPPPGGGAARVPLPPEPRECLDGAHLAALPNGVVLKTLHFFDNFPELAFLHLPTIVDDFRSVQSPEIKALLAAVLSVTRAQLTAPWATPLLSRQHYARYAEEALQAFILRPPKVQIVQAFLIITLFEWGSRDFHKAWIYCGIAFRIM